MRVLNPTDDAGELDMQPGVELDGDTEVAIAGDLDLSPVVRRSFTDAAPLETAVYANDPVTGERKRVASGTVNREADERSRKVAGAIIARQQEKRRVQREEVIYDEEVISYIECRSPDCMGPALWIHGNPFSPLVQGNWETSYKRRDSYWPVVEKPHCQCCDARFGLRRPAEVWFLTQGPAGPAQKKIGLIASPRYVRSMTRNEYDQLVGGDAPSDRALAGEAAQEVQHA